MFLLKIQFYQTPAQFLVTLAQKTRRSTENLKKSVLRKKSQSYQTLAQNLLDPRWFRILGQNPRWKFTLVASHLDRVWRRSNWKRYWASIFENPVHGKSWRHWKDKYSRNCHGNKTSDFSIRQTNSQNSAAWKIPDDQKHNIKCPGCGEVYIGKTSCCLGTRLEEHSTKPGKPMHALTT